MKIRTPYSPLALFTRQRDDASSAYRGIHYVARPGRKDWLSVRKEALVS
jgi:hypothetical protein